MFREYPDDVVAEGPGPGDEDWLKGLRGWPYGDVYDAKQMRAKLKEIGTPVESFRESVLYQRCVDRLPWLAEV